MTNRQRWVEETVDPVTGEQLVFEASTEAELDAQLAARFGDEDLVTDVTAAEQAEVPSEGGR